MGIESFSHNPEVAKIVERLFTDKIFDATRVYVEEHGLAEGLKRFVDDYFDAIGMHPEYSAVEGESLEEAREHLKHDAGIVLVAISISLPYFVFSPKLGDRM